jgi:signal transduction histidine kinase
MSYRTFKRVLGETSLERKCRWWFGLTLGVLLLLSFSIYRRHTDKQVDDIYKYSGAELVRAGWLAVHLERLSEIESASDQMSRDEDDPGDISAAEDSQFYGDLVASQRLLGKEYEWEAILPPLPPDSSGQIPPENRPRDDGVEAELMERWMTPLAPGEEIPSEDRRLKGDQRREYLFYQPMYAKQSCVTCHKTLGKVPRSFQEGDLMAVIRVTMDDQPTVEARAWNSAFMWTNAIVTGFIAMVSLYLIVRYVIVRPVQHLRDVSNAIREGDIEQRAIIRTGDEFEELAAAFNRMLRQLLSQQSELRDVNSELDQRLDELAQANMRLYEMNRLKSDFLATVSHELRTPLNSILGFSDVLRTIDTLEDKQKRYVDNIQNSGRMLLEMINDILDLAKVESGRMEIRPSEFKIGVVLSAQCDMARPLAEKKNIDLETNVAPGLPVIRQDQAKIQQILNNLLSNAIKFTPEGGRVCVSAERDPHDDLRLTVRDTGIGISESDQSLIFEKFRQGTSAIPGGGAMTREYSGTGLGLSIVRELCRLLGGDVTVESMLGKGSTFTVILPWNLEDVPRFDTDLREGLEALTKPMAASAALQTNGTSPAAATISSHGEGI